MAASAGAYTRTKVGGVGFKKEVLPFRNVLLKPFFGLRTELIKVRKIRGDDYAFGSVKF